MCGAAERGRDGLERRGWAHILSCVMRQYGGARRARAGGVGRVLCRVRCAVAGAMLKERNTIEIL